MSSRERKRTPWRSLSDDFGWRPGGAVGFKRPEPVAEKRRFDNPGRVEGCCRFWLPSPVVPTIGSCTVPNGGTCVRVCAERFEECPTYQLNKNRIKPSDLL